MDWHVAIPIVWALVAAGLALILYRSSEAFFSSANVSRNTKTQIKLVGSIVVAGAIFYSLKWSTPPHLLAGIPIDVVARTEKRIRDHKFNVDKLKSCLSAASSNDCKTEIEFVYRTAENLDDDIK